MSTKIAAFSGMILVSGAGLVGGCGTHPEADPTEVVEASQLVATVQLSDTHVVKFWDHGDGLARIDETMNVDLDRDAKLSLGKMDIEGRALADIYKVFAADRTDVSAIQRLHQVDLRVAARAKQELLNPETQPTQIPGDALPASGFAVPPGARVGISTPDGVEVRQNAVVACAEPAYDWQGDVGWFKTNFCGNDAVFCPTEVGWATNGFTKYLTFYRSTAFNQSFCTTALHTVKRRQYHGGLTNAITERTLLNSTLPTRWVSNQAWTGGSYKLTFYTKIASTLDNRVSLAIHQTLR